MTVMKIGTVE